MATTADFNPDAANRDLKGETSDVMSVRHLMWLRFKRNRLALFGSVVLFLMYLSAILAGFIAPYGVRQTHDQFASSPPLLLRFVDEEGNFGLRPFVYALESKVDFKTFQRVYTPNFEKKHYLKFFARGIPYTILGVIQADIHFFQVDDPAKVFLLGTDRQGRDLFSRVFFGAQVSLSVGLVGVTLTLVIGTLVGIAGGYFGGVFDDVSQRIIEVLMAFPQIPLWLALAALVPPTWSSVQVYFAISIVLSVGKLGRAGASSAGTGICPARRGLCDCCAIYERFQLAYHLQTSFAQYDESYPGHLYYFRARYDLGRNSAELFGLGDSTTDDELGIAVERGAAHTRTHPTALVVDSGTVCGRYHHIVQLPG